MDKSLTERNGVNIIDRLLMSTCKVKPIISTEDKGITWDGEIQVFKSESFEKTNLIDVIPVQVKSHVVSKNKTRYSINRDDLNNFKIKRRILYFVVEFQKGSNYKEYRVLYKHMLILDIEKALNSFGNESSKVFDFDEFPQNSKQIMLIISKMITDNKKNNVVKGVTSIDDFLVKRYPNSKFNLSFDLIFPNNLNISHLDICREFKKQKPYFYFHNDEIGMDFMIEKASNAFLTIKKSQPIFIKVDNEVLFNSIEVISNDIRSFQCIGQCIRLFPDGESLKIEFKLDGDIDDRIKALKFMCGLLNKKEIYFGDSKLECNYEETSLDLNNLKNTLVFYEKIKKVLNYFHIKSKYDLSDYDDNRMKILLDIYDCIFENKQVELLFPNNGAAILKIFGLNLLCTINSENKRSFISNYFDDRNRINIKDLDGNTLVENESTYFSLYDINNNPFFIVDNIDLDEMYKQLFTKELNNHKKGLANSIF